MSDARVVEHVRTLASAYHQSSMCVYLLSSCCYIDAIQSYILSQTYHHRHYHHRRYENTVRFSSHLTASQWWLFELRFGNHSRFWCIHSEISMLT